MHAGDGLASGDPADQWVRDPVTGEFRLRLPGEPLPSPGSAPVPPHPGPGPVPGGGSRPAAPRAGRSAGRSRPGDRQPEAAPGGRAARRRSRSRRSGAGLWLAAAAGFVLVVVGGGAYALLRPSSGTARAVASSSPTACPSTAAKAAPSARPSPDPTGLAALPRGPRAAPINVRVTVYNGSGSFGQAEKVLSWMQNSEGFLRTSNGGPADGTARTTLVYAPNHIDQARTLAAAMGLPASALKGTGKGTGLRDPMVLTLGEDFHGLGRPFTEPSPSRSAAAARNCRGG